MSHNHLIIPLLLLILRASCYSKTGNSTQFSNQTVAIQESNETFFTYIPLSSDCNYPPNSSISLGDIQYTLLDASNIFGSIWELNEVVFWGVLVEGMRMLAISQQLLQNGAYNQIVLFNSSLAPPLAQRQLILTTLNNTDIIFNYADASYNHTTNTLIPNVVSRTRFVLSLAIQEIIRNCQQDDLMFLYIGNTTFLGLCANTTKLFAWNSSQPASSFVFTDFSDLGGSSIQNMTNNPYLLVPNYTLNVSSLESNNLSYWNVAFLSQDASVTYFCAVSIGSMACQNHQNQEIWVEVMIQGGWGIETIGQLSQIELILALFPEVTNEAFPGTIISLFSYQSTVFIESQSLNTTYLSIFSGGQQLANTTLKGTIVYYGLENLLLQDSSGNFWIATFVLPIYYPSNLTTASSNFSIQVNCSYKDYQLYYDIFWTSMDYPSYFLQQTNTSPQVSYEGTLVESLNDYYLVIGPAFEVFISSPQNIDIDVLDISEVLTIEAFISVVDVVFISQSGKVNWLPYQAVFLDWLGLLKKYSFTTKQIVAMPQPCSLPTITATATLQKATLFMGEGSVCTCSRNVTSCQLSSSQSVPQIVFANSNSPFEYSLNMKQVHEAFRLDASFTFSPIKRQIISMASYGIVINIYQNNTVALVDIQGSYISSIQSSCKGLNSTDGTVFPRNFFDDFLIIFCYNASTISQYLIRNKQLIYNRDIPLYGFVTVADQNSILSGQNYVFLEVDIDPQYYGLFQSRTNASSCCILRLDPDQFTVSFISEIIQANRLITVYSMYGVDIVFYNETDVSTSLPFVKVYFDSTWVTFYQTDICTPANLSCPPVTYTYGVSYISDLYNFAGAFIQNITFNISASKISLVGSNIEDVLLYKYKTTYTVYNNSVVYNFNNFCGPIAQYYQNNTADIDGNLFSITQNKIVNPNKEITSNYSSIVQLIDLADYAPTSTLAQCLLVVGLANLTFYVKYDGSWLSTAYVVTSTESNCLYFVNQVIGNSSIELGSYCYNLRINTPLITISYDPSATVPFNATFSTMSLPIQLRSISSILTQNKTYIIGLEEGPSQSVTGILYLCEAACNLLMTNDSRVIFFIDYDHQMTKEGLLVVSLDVETLNFWINPNLFPFQNASIPADFNISYQATVNSFCSKVKIVYASLTSPNLILSCATFYQQIMVDLQLGSITLGLKFAKFANCQQIDRFKPQFIVSEGSEGEIEFLAVECQQTVSTVRMQELIQSNSNVSYNIVTDYLLVYTSMGPRCSADEWYPLRIIDLGINGEFMLYNIYWANSQWKLIYEKINGILIDSFIDPMPEVQYELVQMTRLVTYPQISMRISNPYYSLAMTIETHSPKDTIPPLYFYIILGIFVCFNVVTLFFLLCWCLLNKKTNPKKRYPNRRNTLLGKSYTISSRLFASKKQSDFSSAYENSSSISREKPSMNDEVEMGVRGGEPKRRGTEIELFQPR